MRDRVLAGMKKHLEGKVEYRKVCIENMLEYPDRAGEEIMGIFEKHLEMLAVEQSKLENLALFTEF